MSLLSMDKNQTSHLQGRVEVCFVLVMSRAQRYDELVTLFATFVETDH